MNKLLLRLKKKARAVAFYTLGVAYFAIGFSVLISLPLRVGRFAGKDGNKNPEAGLRKAG